MLAENYCRFVDLMSLIMKLVFLYQLFIIIMEILLAVDQIVRRSWLGVRSEIKLHKNKKPFYCAIETKEKNDNHKRD